MPRKNTPINPLTDFGGGNREYPPGASTPSSGQQQDIKLAFAWHLNFKERNHPGDPMTLQELQGLSGIYRWFNDDTLKAYVMMIGGTDYCKSMLALEEPLEAPVDRAAVDRNTVRLGWFRMAQMEQCVRQYILMRGLKPEKFYEVFGSTLYEYLDAPPDGYGGHPNEPPVRLCQPLIRGDQAEAVYLGAMLQRNAEYAETIRDGYYAWRDEWEYDFGKMIKKTAEESLRNTSAIAKAWGAKMVNPMTLPSVFRADLPCLDDYGGEWNTDPDDPAPPPEPGPGPGPSPEPGPGQPCMPPKPSTSSAGFQSSVTGPRFGNSSPAVISPPPQGSGSSGAGAQSGAGAAESCPTPTFAIPGMRYKPAPINTPRYCPVVEKYNDPYNPFSPRVRIADVILEGTDDGSGQPLTAKTDRDYSAATSVKIKLKIDGECEEVIGYTKKDAAQQAADPEVICGMTPVDLMEFRWETFDQCMTQRINRNFRAWVKWIKDPANFDTYNNWSPGGGDSPFDEVKPCSTKYYETDDPNKCRAHWSVQQCCAFAAKPVVGDNFIKGDLDYGVRQEMEQDPPLEPVIEPEYLGTNARGDYEADKQATIELHERLKPQISNLMPTDAYFYFWFPLFEDPKTGKLLGSHLPPMRHYDTGGAARMPRRGASFTNTIHTYDVFGFTGTQGRTEKEAEKALELAQQANPPKPPHELAWVGEPEVPRVGGYGLSFNRMLDQVYNMRYNRMFCVPRYETAFKDLDMDDFVHARAGYYFTTPGDTENPANPSAFAGINWSWPKGWRGYGSESFVNPGDGFPYFNNPGGIVAGGLDNARTDDIIVVDIDGVPRTYWVVMKGTYADIDPQGPLEIDPIDVRSTRADWLIVESMNTGKHLSSTGISDQYGISRRQLFFRGDVTLRDQKYQGLWKKLYEQDLVMGAFVPSAYPPGHPYYIGWTPSCFDPNYMACTVPSAAWGSARVFRPFESYRACPQGLIHQVPPGETGQYPASLFSYCYNHGDDPPMKPPGQYDWVERGKGGFQGVGTGDVTYGSFCSPDYPRGADDNPIGSSADGAWGSCPSADLPFTPNLPLP